MINRRNFFKNAGLITSSLFILPNKLFGLTNKYTTGGHGPQGISADWTSDFTGILPNTKFVEFSKIEEASDDVLNPYYHHKKIVATDYFLDKHWAIQSLKGRRDVIRMCKNNILKKVVVYKYEDRYRIFYHYN